MPPTELTLAGGTLEVLDIAGDPDQPGLVLLHEGLGSVGLWRGFPERLAAATGRRTVAFSRHGHGQSDPPPRPRTPSFMHEEALEVLPDLFAGLNLKEPVLIGHSDGASIALIYAADHPASAVVAIAPHVFVEDMCPTEIRHARDAYETSDLRERMARHHRDPDAAFFGWNDVWLDPAFPEWSITDLIERITVRCSSSRVSATSTGRWRNWMRSSNGPRARSRGSTSTASIRRRPRCPRRRWTRSPNSSTGR